MNNKFSVEKLKKICKIKLSVKKTKKDMKN